MPVTSSQGFWQRVQGWLGNKLHHGCDDAQLLERFVTTRDETAFQMLLERHGPMVWGVCRRVLRHTQDAEDAFQATFLVLVRRAEAIRKLGSVSSWLHGVALRTAQKARVQAARRHAREAQAASDVLVPEAELMEQHPALEEELARLPDKYRLPLVLCYYEGHTLEHAAQSLGWPLGTVAGRMSRAREQLRLRLEKRGVALTAAVVAATLAERACAAQPPALTEKALHTCLAWLSPEKAVPATVLSLAQGVLRSMFWSKMKVIAGSLALVVFLGLGAGLFLKDAWAAVPQPGNSAGHQKQGDGSGKQATPPSDKEQERTQGFQVSGKIKEVLVKPGDTVKAGQVLAKLDDALVAAEVEHLQAQLDRHDRKIDVAEAEAKVNASMFQRDQKLFEQKAISAQEREISKFRMDKAVLEFQAAKAERVITEKLLNLKKLELQRHTLICDFEGVVTAVYKHRNESIEAHTPFVTIRVQDKK